MTSSPPTSRRQIILVGTATAFSLLGDQVLYSVLPVYFDELGLSAIQVGILLSANRWIRLLTNELANRVNGGRAWFVGAFMLGAATTAMYVFTQWFTVLLAARLLWGLAWSFIRHIGVTSMMAHADPTQPGRTMGLYNGISRIGSVGGLFGGALLVDLAGFVPAMIVLAVVSLAAAPFAFFGYRAPGVVPERAHGDRVDVRYPILGFALGAVGPGLVMATLGAVLADHTGPELAVSAATLTGALLAARFVLDTAAAPYLGSVTDSLGMRRAGLLFFGLGAVALMLASVAAGLTAIALAVIVFFICGTALQAGVAGTVSRMGPSAFARYVTSADFGAACGPLFGWFAFDWFALPWLGLALGALTYLACCALLWFWRF